ncbi:hypothetical protein HMPREF2626_06840 [Aerococcus sp. HMSC062A02]|nr:hypothetical protein HMPREF2626_06840 [Aerococcus sp. HMSC062A02]OHO43195.1 hypothetical protein HMPREF2705_08670 [Aerococcus sp. HMSC035B07]
MSCCLLSGFTNANCRPAICFQSSQVQIGELLSALKTRERKLAICKLPSELLSTNCPQLLPPEMAKDQLQCSNPAHK